MKTVYEVIQSYHDAERKFRGITLELIEIKRKETDNKIDHATAITMQRATLDKFLNMI